MSEQSAVPQKLPTNQFDHFYLGGNKIGALRDGPGGPRRPEEWIASMTTRFGEATQGLSVLDSGEFLRDLVTKHPELWLGREHVNTFGASTEILVKLLDPDQRLPVHYHPNRKFAKEHLALTHGKTEAWIILEAPVGASVGLGFSREYTKEEIATLVEARDADALLASLQSVEVVPGDAILVPAGVPHAIGAGIFVLELQEPTDLSILLEWNDFAVDGLKDGHLNLGFDTALDALRYSPISPDELQTLVSKGVLFGASSAQVFSSAANPYFRADYLTGAGSVVDAGFSILLVLGDSGLATFAVGEPLAVKRGDTLVIPHSSGSWTLEGASALLSRPPLPEFASQAI